MKILLSGRIDTYRNESVRTYFLSIFDSLKAHGHEVSYIRNTDFMRIKDKGAVDLILDVDCGRGSDGKLRFIGDSMKPDPLSAVVFTDSHGYPSLHRRIAKNYDHVFYAVWDKRELFKSHPSAHWLPNYTDLKYFNGPRYADLEPEFDWGFFGSKGGHDRAKPMIEVCEKFDWSYDVREIGRKDKHRWPRTATAMANCKYLFGHGQKHDLNFRVFESMAVGRCLVNDRDPRSGIDSLFQEGTHYCGYKPDYSNLENVMLWVYNNPSSAKKIASNAFELVTREHTVHNRVERILEVVTNG